MQEERTSWQVVQTFSLVLEYWTRNSWPIFQYILDLWTTLQMSKVPVYWRNLGQDSCLIFLRNSEKLDKLACCPDLLYNAGRLDKLQLSNHPVYAGTVDNPAIVQDSSKILEPWARLLSNLPPKCTNLAISLDMFSTYVRGIAGLTAFDSLTSTSN